MLVVAVYIPTNSFGGFSFLHTLSSLYYFTYFDNGHLDWCEVVYSFDLHFFDIRGTSLVTQMVKHLPKMRETRV